MKKQLLFRKTISKLELIIVILIIVIFLVVGIFCASRVYPVWFDEVTVLDPAMNLYLGKGFTSTTTSFSKEEFYVDSTLLYPALAFLWMKIFGSTITAIRSLNYVLTAASALIIYVTVIRLNLITVFWSRIALILLLIASTGITYNYQSGRYDLTSITLCATTFFIYSLKKDNIRYILLSCIGFFFPLSSLSLVIYSILLMGILLIFDFSRSWKNFLALLIGIVIGVICLIGLYYVNDVLDNFLALSSRQGILDGKSSENILTTIIERIHNSFYLLVFNKSSYICLGCRQDTSYKVIFILASFLFVYQILSRKNIKLSLFGFSSALLIPLGMCYFAKYPLYYSWMSFIPLTITSCASMETVVKNRSNHLYRYLIASIIVIFVFSSFLLGKSTWKHRNYSVTGLPRKTSAAVKAWQERDYKRVENFVEDNITYSDIVYTDESTFYAIKSKVDQVYFPRYVKSKRNRSKPEIKNISILILNEKSITKWLQPTLEELSEIIGGNWYKTEDELNTEFYYLKIYRRK